MSGACISGLLAAAVAAGISASSLLCAVAGAVYQLALQSLAAVESFPFPLCRHRQVLRTCCGGFRPAVLSPLASVAPLLSSASCCLPSFLLGMLCPTPCGILHGSLYSAGCDIGALCLHFATIRASLLSRADCCLVSKPMTFEAYNCLGPVRIHVY